MNDIVKVVPADEGMIELIKLLKAINQSNEEKYEVLKPIADRLHLYCDKINLKLKEESNKLAIPLDTISGTIYEEEEDILFISFKRNEDLHAINISNHIHIIYVTERKQHSIVSFFLRIYHLIKITINVYRLSNK